MESSKSVGRRQREPVLVVAHPGGFLDVFASKNVDVLIVNFPDVQHSENEQLAEDYLTATLPWRYRQLYMPGKIRKSGFVEATPPKELRRRANEKRIFAAIDKAQKVLSRVGDEPASEVSEEREVLLV